MNQSELNQAIISFFDKVEITDYLMRHEGPWFKVSFNVRNEMGTLNFSNWQLENLDNEMKKCVKYMKGIKNDR